MARMIGEVSIERTLGDIPVVARFVGEDVIFDKPQYITSGCTTWFDGIANAGFDNPHNPTATTWKDIITGNLATFQGSVHFQNYGVYFGGTATPTDRIDFVGGYLGQGGFTIFNSHIIASGTLASYQRFYAESLYPTLYIHTGSGQANSYGFFAMGKDMAFEPKLTPPRGTMCYTAVRWTGVGKPAELFYNGNKVGEVLNVTQQPPDIATKYIGGRLDNSRTMHGTIFEHMTFDRALTNDEILHNYLISKKRYG